MNKLTRWDDPFAGLTNLHSHIDSLFNDFFSGTNWPADRRAPALDVYTEDDKRLITEVHAPGLSEDDIDIRVHEGVLEIKGQKHEREEDKDKKRNYMLRESSVNFYRRIALPKHADADNIEASFDNGVLKVVVPFKDLPQPKRIQIGSGKKK